MLTIACITSSPFPNDARCTELPSAFVEAEGAAEVVTVATMVADVIARIAADGKDNTGNPAGVDRIAAHVVRSWQQQEVEYVHR